ncbi:MAG: ECF transporter S component [Microthrixaceae bacterium]|nr:ECF transporter S component [Microthrixaceae bacterium]
MFLWPLILSPSEGQDHSANAPFLLFALLPGLLAVGLSQAAAGGLDAKAVAMLGVLSAVGAALRPLGAGVAGIEVVFFLLILAGRVFGAGFGFLLGSTTLFASALLTGGVGPWLPFQMLASSWVGAGAGLLPRRARGGREIALLVAYGVVAAYLYGFLMNMWFWPFAIGNETSVSFVAGDPVLENLHRFVVFTLLTSTWGWDTGPPSPSAMAIVAVGPSVLVVLRRTARRAAFGAAIALEDRPDITSGAAGRRVGAEQHPVRE